MRVSLSWKRVILFFLCSTFTFSSLSIAKLPWSLYIMIQIACAVVLVSYVLINSDILLMKRYRVLNLLALAYNVSTLVSVWMNGQLSLYTLVVFVQAVSILPFIEIQREKGHIYFFCKVELFWLAVFLLASDALMVLMPGSFYGDGISKTFLVGNKFETSYHHIMLLMMVCLLFGKNPKVRRYLPILFIAVLYICHYIDCNTAMIGTAVFLLITYSPAFIQNIFSRKWIAALVIFLCAIFIFYGQIARSPLIKYLVTEHLGRDVTLTGRDQIYDILPKLIRARPWIGYGDSAEIISRYTGAFNAQNGFFDLVVQNGIPSALLYTALLIAMIRKGASRDSAALLGGIYGYLLMSTVEMTFGTTLILFGILLYTDRNDYREEPVPIFEWGEEKVDPCVAMRQ